MRKHLILLPLLLTASPAFAQVAPDTAQIQRALNDPATANKLTNVMQAMSNAFLNLPVGEGQAAVEGRQATPAERHMTVRDVARQHDPNFDRDFQRQVAQAGPMLHQGMQAISQAIPPMMQGLEQASKSLERAAANMPDPNYPRR